jgi:dTMP kinase
MGSFITFEGVEGSGKSTQLRLAADRLAERAIPFVTTVEPGGTPLGQKIRDMLLNRGLDAPFPETELLLFCAARAQHVHEVIAPALATGKVGLCDRFADATLVYQGYGRGLDKERILAINTFATGGVMPDLTLLFDLPVEDGLERAFSRIARNGSDQPEDRFERENRTFHDRIRAGYLAEAARSPDRFRILDAARPIPEIQTDVSACMEAHLRRRGYAL